MSARKLKINLDSYLDFTAFLRVPAKIGLMNRSVQSTAEPTLHQLLERERSLRIMASTALTVEESAALLALVEHYASLIDRRQLQDDKLSS